MKVLRNTSYLIFGNIIIQIIPILFLLVFTRLYSTEAYGIFAKFTAIAAILSTISIGQFQFAIVLNKKEKLSHHIFSYCLFINILITILIGIVLSFLNLVFNFDYFDAFGNYPITLILLYSFLLSINQILIFWNNNRSDYKKISVGRVILTLSTVGATLFFGLKGNYEGLIIGQLIGACMQFLFFVLSSKGLKIIFDFSFFKSFISEYKDLFLFTLPHSFFDVLKKNFMIFLVGGYYGDAILGLFSIAEKLIKIPTAIISSAFSEVFLNESARYMEGQKIDLLKSKVLTYIKIGLLLILGPWLFTFLFAEYFCELLLEDNWLTVGTYIKWMSPLMIVFFISSPLSVLPLVLNKQKAFFILVLILNLILFAVLIPITMTKPDIFIFIAVLTTLEFILLSYLSYWNINIIQKQ